MSHSAQNRTPILYQAQTLTDGPLGDRTILFFYPGGEWDGWRRREETCEAAYPQSEYLWVDMDQDFVSTTSDEPALTEVLYGSADSYELEDAY